MNALTADQVLALPALVGVTQAAAAIGGISQATVYREVAAGTFPLEPIRVGSRILFRRADILALLGIRSSPTPTGDEQHDGTGDAPRTAQGAPCPTHDAPPALRPVHQLGESHAHHADRSVTRPARSA